MICKECGQVVLSSPALMNKCHSNTELSPHEGTRCQFNGGTGVIKLGIGVHQDFYVVVEQAEGGSPKPLQRFENLSFPRCAGDRTRAQRSRGTKARYPPAARTVGQSAQTVGSSGTQLNGQSRPRAGAELVEAARFCSAPSASVDERAACK